MKISAVVSISLLGLSLQACVSGHLLPPSAGMERDQETNISYTARRGDIVFAERQTRLTEGAILQDGLPEQAPAGTMLVLLSLIHI